jgi:hypothetical protein
MKTISRSATRKIAELKERLTGCRVYTLGNQFQGKAVEPRHAWEALAASSGARLADNGDGTCTVRVHSNYWYELRAAQPEAPAEAEEDEFWAVTPADQP